LAAISFRTMDSKIEFTFAELNALNKLLGQVKTESHLTADELDFFSLSPHIISSFEKIHKEFMNHIREQVKDGKLKMSGPPKEFKPADDFQLTDNKIGDRETRIRNLGQHGKDYIKKLDKVKREEYCDLVFAPFKPSDEQRKKLIEILESIAEE
jgi:hypothetical protein